MTWPLVYVLGVLVVLVIGGAVMCDELGTWDVVTALLLLGFVWPVLFVFLVFVVLVLALDWLLT
jgi:hypothetical protein